MSSRAILLWTLTPKLRKAPYGGNTGTREIDEAGAKEKNHGCFGCHSMPCCLFFVCLAEVLVCLVVAVAELWSPGLVVLQAVVPAPLVLQSCGPSLND